MTKKNIAFTIEFTKAEFDVLEDILGDFEAVIGVSENDENNIKNLKKVKKALKPHSTAVSMKHNPSNEFTDEWKYIYEIINKKDRFSKE